jgi:stage V sporulation protein G
MDELIVSEIQIIPVKPKDGLIAFASCIINNQFYLGNIAIYTSPSSNDGFRLVYPIKLLPTGKQIYCAHPINRRAGEVIHNAVVGRYNELLEKFKM